MHARQGSNTPNSTKIYTTPKVKGYYGVPRGTTGYHGVLRGTVHDIVLRVQIASESKFISQTSSYHDRVYDEVERSPKG